MIQKLFVLPLALVAAVSLVGPVLACGDNESCTECKVESGAAPAAKPVKGELVTTTYKVEGMHCDKCAAAIDSKLSTLSGVSKVHADYSHKSLTVVHAKGQADMGKLQAAVGTNFKLAAAPAVPAVKAAAGDDCCAAEGDACKDEHHADAKATAAHGACAAGCTGECHEGKAPVKAAPKK